MPDFFTSFRDTLHQAFIYGVHLTAKEPMLIEPKPPAVNWTVLKRDLLHGWDLDHNQDGSSNATKRDTVAVILDNTIRDIQIQARYGQQFNATDSLGIGRLMLRAVRQIMPTMLAFEVVGVQPMKGPVDTINILRANATDKFAQITNQMIAAKTHLMKARWKAFDVAESVQAEILTVLAEEVREEHDQALIQRLHDAAPAPISPDENEHGAAFIEDHCAQLALTIYRQANAIAAKSRRGAGNWCIVSEYVLSILRSTKMYNPATKLGSKFAGMLNDSIRVYVDPHAADDAPVLIGFKGSDYDAAGCFCPYILVTTNGATIDQQTFEPTLTFSSRYGLFMLPKSEEWQGDASDYLSQVEIRTQSYM